MPSVQIRENESFDYALRRFKRSCEKAGILTELRGRQYREKPTEIRKRKAAAAVKRQARKTIKVPSARRPPVRTTVKDTKKRRFGSR